MRTRDTNAHQRYQRQTLGQMRITKNRR